MVEGRHCVEEVRQHRGTRFHRSQCRVMVASTAVAYTVSTAVAYTVSTAVAYTVSAAVAHTVSTVPEGMACRHYDPMPSTQARLIMVTKANLVRERVRE
jgi:hypothetical protein